MLFIDTVPVADAKGQVRDMYARQQQRWGYVPNYALAFCHRPELMGLWANLLAGIRRTIAPRTFELATLAAAHELRNTACSLAHGQALTTFFSDDEVCAIANGDYTCLTEAEAAMVRLARKVAADAAAVTQADIDAMRSHGFGEGEIFDVVITAAARAFFTKVLDGVGVQADAQMSGMSAMLRETMAVGRPMAVRPSEALAD